jgi:N-acetyl-alpha-D-glucosaminyl L-malate synthase BshA
MVSDCFPSRLNPYLCTFIEDLAKRLGAVTELYVLTLKRRGEAKVNAVDGIQIFRVLHIENPLYTFLDAPSVVATIIRLVRKFSIDLIHAQFAFPSGFYCVLAKKIVKRPVVITTHRYDVVNLKEDRGAPGVPFFRICITYALKRADAVLAVSEDIKKETVKLGAHPNKTFVIYNAVNEDFFNPNLDTRPIKDKLNIKENEKMIFTLCHLIRRKGIDYLLHALPLVVRHYEKVKLVIGGDGPERNNLIKLTRALKLEEKVIFTGRIPPKELPLFYAASNLFVLPSLHEGHCVALLEAMAAGLPVVATKVGGNTESVVDGYNGFLVAPKDPRALAKSVLRIITDHDLEIKFGENSIKLYKAKFSSEKQIKKIIEVYKRVVIKKNELY